MGDPEIKCLPFMWRTMMREKASDVIEMDSTYRSMAEEALRVAEEKANVAERYAYLGNQFKTFLRDGLDRLELAGEMTLLSMDSYEGREAEFFGAFSKIVRQAASDAVGTDICGCGLNDPNCDDILLGNDALRRYKILVGDKKERYFELMRLYYYNETLLEPIYKAMTGAGREKKGKEAEDRAREARIAADRRRRESAAIHPESPRPPEPPRPPAGSTVERPQPVVMPRPEKLRPVFGTEPWRKPYLGFMQGFEGRPREQYDREASGPFAEKIFHFTCMMRLQKEFGSEFVKGYGRDYAELAKNLNINPNNPAAIYRKLQGLKK